MPKVTYTALTKAQRTLGGGSVGGELPLWDGEEAPPAPLPGAECPDA